MQLAKEYGATDVLNYKDGPIDEQVQELLGGGQPDSCIATGGTSDTFARCLKMVKPNGYVTNLQAQTFDTEIPADYTCLLYTSCGYCGVYQGMCFDYYRALRRRVRPDLGFRVPRGCKKRTGKRDNDIG